MTNTELNTITETAETTKTTSTGKSENRSAAAKASWKKSEVKVSRLKRHAFVATNEVTGETLTGSYEKVMNEIANNCQAVLTSTNVSASEGNCDTVDITKNIPARRGNHIKAEKKGERLVETITAVSLDGVKVTIKVALQ